MQNSMFLFELSYNNLTFQAAYEDKYSTIKIVRFIIKNHPFCMDTSLRKQRLRVLTGILAGISGLLSIGHFIVLGLGVSLAKELNAQYQRYVDYPPSLYININIPFAAFLAIFGAIQLAASLATLFFNMKRTMLDKISLIALGGAAASFVVSFLVTTAAVTYNRQVAGSQRDSKGFPSLIPFYHWLQVDALLNGMLSLPFLLFIFYKHLEGYLQSQQTVTQPGKKQFWVFALLVNACAHFALVIRTYQFSYNQDPQGYSLEVFFSSYTYSLVVELAASLIAFIILALHFELFTFIRTPLFKSCLTRSQAIIVAVAAALFQLAAFVIILSKTLQVYMDRGSQNAYRDCFFFRDCDEEKSFEIFVTFILIISACSLGALLFNIKGLPTIQSEKDKQNSLLSEGHQQA